MVARATHDPSSEYERHPMFFSVLPAVPRLLTTTARALAVALTLGCALPGLAIAQEPASTDMPVPEQVVLTPDMVERFIASWPDFQVLGDNLAETRGVDPSATTPTAAFQSWAKEEDAKADIDKLVAKHGFASLAEWSRVAESVMLAFSYDEEGLTDERLAEVLAEIESSPQIPDDQKAMAAEQVRAYFAAARAVKPLPENVAVIQPYLDDLAEITGAAPPADDGDAPDADAPADDRAGETQD